MNIIVGSVYLMGFLTNTLNYNRPNFKMYNIKMNTPMIVQGGSLKTWSFSSHDTNQVQIVLSTEGRPMDADVQLWHGPDNTPTKMKVYTENGETRPFTAIINTPNSPNTVAVQNKGQVEFPLGAYVFTSPINTPTNDCESSSEIVQGGALKTYSFNPFVDSVQVLLKTNGRPLNARIELLQGPNNNKQIIDVYTEDGLTRPFFAIIKTPYTGNVVRIVNTAPLEFPMTASIVPYTFITEEQLNSPEYKYSS